MAINREWHIAHRMPPKPNLDERVAWHLDHARHCSCRPPSGTVLDEFRRRGIALPGEGPG